MMQSLTSRLGGPFVTGTIAGRSANLWVAAIAAIFNMVVLFNLIVASETQVAAVNIAIVSLVALFANASDTTSAAALATSQAEAIAAGRTPSRTSDTQP